jgi:ATP-dependent Zn protease
MSKPRDREGEMRRWAERHGLPIVSRAKTAQHEAAHAVIARVLTLKSGRATIKRNYAEGSEGYHITHRPEACGYEWEKRGRYRGSLDAALHARIITYMAGAEAETILTKREAWGDGDDRYRIELMAGELSGPAPWQRLEPRLRAMTRTLVRRHWKLIRRVARALLAKETLTGREIDRLIGRSVNDVKPNYAGRFLKMMAAGTHV